MKKSGGFFAFLKNIGVYFAGREKLEKIALESDAGDKRYIAVSRIDNPAVLARVALRDVEKDIRDIALGKITFDDIHRALISEERDFYFPPEYVSLCDTETLAKIALNGKDYLTRKTAVERITDKELLAKIALRDSEAEVRRSALSGTEYQNILYAFISEEHDFYFPSEYVSLCDAKTLTKIAQKDKNKNVRIAAAQRISDPNELYKIIKSGGDESVHHAVMKRAEKLLAEVVLNDNNGKVSPKKEMIYDPNVLAKIILNDEDYNTRIFAVKHITDQELLTEIALNDKDYGVRHFAAERVTDREKRKEIERQNERLKTQRPYYAELLAEKDIPLLREKLRARVNELSNSIRNAEWDDVLLLEWELRDLYTLFGTQDNFWNVSVTRCAHIDSEEWAQCVWCDHVDYYDHVHYDESFLK